MKSKTFLFAVLVTLVCAVFTQSDFPLFLLGFAFLLWISLFVCARILCRCVDITLCPPVPQTVRGREMILEARLVNRSPFPVSEIRVAVKCRDQYSGEVHRFSATAMLDGKGESTLRFVLQARHCGMLTVWGDSIQIGDPIGIHLVKDRFPNQKWEIAVMPEPQSEGEPQAVSHRMVSDMETESGIGGIDGDHGTAYELRAYQEGEPLRNVHWKMTAKTDELMVKEFIRETEPMTLCFLDLNLYGRPYSRTEWDGFLDKVASMASTMLHTGNHFALYWLDAQSRQCRNRVRNGDDANAALTALLRETPHSGATGESGYKEILTHEAYNAVVCINLWGEITREEATR